MARIYDIIAFDLDGTLTPSKSPLEKDMAELLGQLLAHKYKLAVISGASYERLEDQFFSHLSCSSEALAALFLLPTDGAMFCTYENRLENRGWKCIHEYSFTDEEKQKVYTAFETAFIETKFTQPQKIYGPIFEDRITEVSFSPFGMDAPLEIKKDWDPDHAKRATLLKVIKPLLPEFSVHIGGTTTIDVTRAGVDKAYGLNTLLKKLSVPANRMLFLGDELFPDGNDAPARTTGAVCIQVKDPEETKVILRGLLADAQ